MSSVYQSVPYRWVIKSYPHNSDRGKSVLAHAEHGVGYVLYNKQRTKSDPIIVAFRHPKHHPIPDGAAEANLYQEEALEKRFNRGD